MAAERYATSHVREMPFAVQALLFFVLSQTLKYFALTGPPVAEGLSVRNLTLIALLFTPFVWARIPVLLAITPRIFLRSEARVEIHEGGLIYHFDGVKRPLFVEWPDLERLTRTRFGLRFAVRHEANVTEAMPSYQAQFWRGKIRTTSALRTRTPAWASRPIHSARAASPP